MPSTDSATGTLLLAAGLALAALACDEGGVQRPLECWYRTYSHGYLSSTDCPLESCSPTGNGDEILCSCLSLGCECERLRWPEVPGSTEKNPFNCIWARQTCYQGEPAGFEAGATSCDCYAGFLCWAQCEGRTTADGRRVCMADGSEVECLSTPPRDEEGKVVLCRFGATPVSWPLTN